MLKHTEQVDHREELLNDIMQIERVAGGVKFDVVDVSNKILILVRKTHSGRVRYIANATVFGELANKEGSGVPVGGELWSTRRKAERRESAETQECVPHISKVEKMDVDELVPGAAQGVETRRFVSNPVVGGSLSCHRPEPSRCPDQRKLEATVKRCSRVTRSTMLDNLAGAA